MRNGALLTGIFAALLAGCSPGPELTKVTGKIVIAGHSADGIRVEFHPDVAAGTTGPSSVGETDAEGNFTLTCLVGETAKEGAIVGKHRVVLQDLRLAQSETGRGIPLRFAKAHAAVLTTPLTAEVQAAGDEAQTITLEPQLR